MKRRKKPFVGGKRKKRKNQSKRLLHCSVITGLCFVVQYYFLSKQVTIIPSIKHADDENNSNNNNNNYDSSGGGNHTRNGDNPFIVPSTVTAMITTITRDFEYFETSNSNSSSESSGSNATTQDKNFDIKNNNNNNNNITTSSSTPSSTSFTMPRRNETLEMERYQIFSDKSFFPKQEVFWSQKDDKPTSATKFLLDYVVAGFAKCGTTTIGIWLSQQPEIQSFNNEKYYISLQTSKMVNDLYSSLLRYHTTEKRQQQKTKKQQQHLPILPTINNTATTTTTTTTITTTRPKIGFRCPHHIQSPKGLKLLREPYFSETKVIVSIRHPVSWFESYYNYRLQQREFSLLKGKPNELIGQLTCQGCDRLYILSTAKGAFHWYLSKLMKTPMNTKEELELLKPFEQQHNRKNGGSSGTDNIGLPNNKIFLLETRQLADTLINISTTQRAMRFRNDIQEFLQLKQPVGPMIKVMPGSSSKERGGIINKNDTIKIDICNDEYLPLRGELMNISRNASIWFREYFIKSTDVYVSSPDYLIHLLQDWMVDPCDR